MGCRLHELDDEAVAAGRRGPRFDRVAAGRRTPVGIDHPDVDGIAGLDLVVAPCRGECRRDPGRLIVGLEPRPDHPLERPVLQFLLGEDRAAGGEEFGVAHHGHRGRLLDGILAGGERLGERVADGVATDEVEHVVALHRGAQLGGDLAGEPGLRFAERKQVEPLLVAAGGPDADLDLRRLSHHGEIAVFEIDLQRLAGDEELLVAEHAELHLRGYVVPATEQVEPAFEDPAANVVGHASERLLQEASRLFDFLLIGLQERQLIEGLGLHLTVGPAGEPFEQLAGLVKLPREAVHLGHPQFRVPLPRGAVKVLGRRDPFVERPRLGILAAGQRDVAVGHEQAGLPLGRKGTGIRLAPGEQELAQFASPVVVSRLGVLTDEPGGERRIELLEHLRHGGRMRRVEIPRPLQLAGGELDLRFVDRPARVAPGHRIAAAERKHGVGADANKLGAGGFRQRRAQHLQAALGNRSGHPRLARLGDAGGEGS